ncbi:MAG: cytochrome c-type biogenesis protein CcmH [Rhizobiales bacterium]|nr:cytochrome c-type biogenesis protein CcmH [Hyphomicrobiales bacterium]
MRWLRLLVILLLFIPASHAVAVQPDEILADPAKEARARELSKQLRCMVCQNQSIDDSDAPLARDLRILVRERLQAGDSNSQVLDFLVQRYGEFVLLRPRLHWRTALLWLAPPVLLIGGGLVLFLLARRRGRSGAIDTTTPQGGALTADEERRLAGLMKPDDR